MAKIGGIAISDTHIEVLESPTPDQILEFGLGALRGTYKNLQMIFEKKDRVKISYEPTEKQWAEIFTGTKRS